MFQKQTITIENKSFMIFSSSIIEVYIDLTIIIITLIVNQSRGYVVLHQKSKSGMLLGYYIRGNNEVNGEFSLSSSWTVQRVILALSRP